MVKRVSQVTNNPAILDPQALVRKYQNIRISIDKECITVNLCSVNTTFDLGADLIERLKKHAVPYEDRTPVDTIRRILDQLEAGSQSAAPSLEGENGARQGTSELAQLDVRKPPNLHHARVHGTIGPYTFSNWNDLLRIAHKLGFEKAGSFEELKKISAAPMRPGEHDDSGFTYLPELGFSLQGLDANRAWEYAIHLAKRIPVPVEAVVQWRHTEKAAHPGESARLAWSPGN